MPSIYNYNEVLTFLRNCLIAKGFKEDDATYMAAFMAETDARGFTSHGLRQINLYTGIWNLEFDPNTEPEILRETDATAVISGKNRYPSMLILRHAMNLAAEKADKLGIAHIAILDTDWIAAPGPHLIRLADRGLLSIIFLQNCGYPCAVPFNGIEARLSTNPLAFAIPREDTFPIVADFSTSTLSLGKVNEYNLEGYKTPTPRFVNPDGELVNDPEIMNQGGAMLPTGGMVEGYKGMALSLWIEAITAVSGGSAQNPSIPPAQNYCLTVYSPKVLSNEANFRSEMSRLSALVKDTRPMSGTPGVFLPGEQSHARLQKALNKGLPVSDFIRNELKEVEKRCGVKFPAEIH